MSKKRGFTLLELLIVIAILSTLAAVAIFVLNPAETLREARDTQRVSDLATIKTAVALYITKTTGTLSLDGSGGTLCKVGSGTDTIFYSYPSDSPGAAITDATLDGGTLGVPAPGQATNANLGTVAGSGWIRINLSGLTGGSPISDFPVDPTNTIANAAAVAGTDLVYRYMCNNDNTFEFNGNLESASVGTREGKDGGNNTGLYEVGTNLTILGAGTDF